MQIFASQKEKPKTLQPSAAVNTYYYIFILGKNIKKVFWMQCLNTTTILFPQENQGVIGSMTEFKKLLLAEVKDM